MDLRKCLFVEGLSCMIRGVADGETFIVRDYKEEDGCKIIDEYLKQHILDPEEENDS